MGRVGYEYEYRFSEDDEINGRYLWDYHPPGCKLLLFEMRTVFMIKKIDGDDHLIIGSEAYDGVLDDDGKPDERRLMPTCFGVAVSFRLPEYWMPEDEFERFNNEAVDFARKAAAKRASDDIIPIAADVVVRTVQLEGEPIEQTMNRAIRQEELVPVYLWPFSSIVNELLCDYDRARYVINRLERTRVESVDEGLALMRVCSVCARTPTIGAQITVLPSCNHAFHSRCISLHLLDHDHCPSCSVHVPLVELNMHNLYGI